MVQCDPGFLKKRDRNTVKDLNGLTAAEIGFLYCDKLFEKDRRLKDDTSEGRKAKRLEE